jgi:hypothetical protein
MTPKSSAREASNGSTLPAHHSARALVKARVKPVAVAFVSRSPPRR